MEEVIMFVGRGVASGGSTKDDDAIVDDVALAELEEEFVEEERSDIMREIDHAAHRCKRRAIVRGQIRR
jgi:hypothetical protein